MIHRHHCYRRHHRHYRGKTFVCCAIVVVVKIVRIRGFGFKRILSLLLCAKIRTVAILSRYGGYITPHRYQCERRQYYDPDKRDIQPR